MKVFQKLQKAVDQKKKAKMGEEVEQVDEVNYAGVRRINREYHRKKEADEMAARKRDPKVKGICQRKRMITQCMIPRVLDHLV